MTHIIAQKKGFAFIHIPKNGGSTIRDQFAGFDDCGQTFFYSENQHPVLGDVAYWHLPLWAIADHHPNEFAMIEGAWAAALTRDPESRFRSALAQRARQHLGKPIDQLSKTERRHEADAVMRHLEDNAKLPNAAFCHFTRQIDFVSLEGAQVVKNVYPIEQIDNLTAEFAQRAGIAAKFGAANKTEVTRHGALGQAARTAWRLAKPLMPASVQDKARARLRDVVVGSVTATDNLEIMDERLLGFVRDFYAADYDLHRQSSQSAASPKQMTQEIAQTA
ncbi:MAG: hypothetical protein AAFQ09_07765 [Pseudomonadota bacterium]